MAKTVFVGLSGGVDSSVAAALLRDEGYTVVGVYMKNWSQDLPGFPCPWKDDYQDAKRVAVRLGIDFKLYDFETEYRQKVVEYMIDEYTAGRTPNPDIMCNQEVKFKLFLSTALSDGADMIATGHYARVVHAADDAGAGAELHMAHDTNKDQTYFLYRVTQLALERTLFPLGGLTKPQVRELAARYGLITAQKKESMGICFVGKVGIKEFLSQYVTAEPGDVVDESGRVVGHHDGAIFYTIGQRHGLNIGGGLPYYVTHKNMDTNEVFVTRDINHRRLWTREFEMADVHWISHPPIAVESEQLVVRTRHRAPLIAVKHCEQVSEQRWRIELSEDIRAVTAGQSAVIYQGTAVLGGGIVLG